MKFQVTDFQEYLTSLGSSKFTRLWPAQEHVLVQYCEGFTSKRDVAIELPTGAGKTLIALLISGAWLKQGLKVAILSANKTLARQMKDEAEALNLPVAYMEGRGTDIPSRTLRSFQRARSIGIMNYWVHINQNPAVDPADIIVMDDAHLAEHCLHSLYSVEVSRPDHPELFMNLVRELHDRFPDYTVLSDALFDEVPPGRMSAELVSFIDHNEAADRITEIFDSATRNNDTDLSYRWARLRPMVCQSNMYISHEAVWLRPYVYPLINNEHYRDTRQVLYMSATVGEPGDLARRLGTRPIEKISVPMEHLDRSSGRRLIVMNPKTDDSDIPDGMSRALLSAIRNHSKSVWLCTSKREAVHLQGKFATWLEDNDIGGHRTWLLTALGNEIDQFRNATAGHLFVAGRFDGMDFSGGECRIVVVRTLPKAVNLQEEFLVSCLGDTGFMRKRLNQRIVQALGRCNRADDDYGIYFLADQRFATHFSREDNRDGIPQHICAELDLAQDLSEESDEKLDGYVAAFVKGDFSQYDEEIEALRAELPDAEPPNDLRDTSHDEVTGWAALFESKNYDIAQARFECCWEKAKADNLREAAALHGWHWAKSLFLAGLLGDEVAREKALQVFEQAIQRGGRQSWFNRMRASLNRARAVSESVSKQLTEGEYADVVIRCFDEELERRDTRGPRFQRFVDQHRTKLQASTHAQYLEGLEELGTLLGYNAKRPRHNASTDCLWRGEFGSVRECVTFEAKIEDDVANYITASDLGQAHNQESRAQMEFGQRGYSVRATIVTHLTDVADDAISSIGNVRIVPKYVLLELSNRIVSLLTEYRRNWSLDDVRARNLAAGPIRGRLPKTGWLLRGLASEGSWISRETFLDEWL